MAQDPKIAERLAKLRAKMANTDTGGGSGFWSPGQGSSIIRILPEVTKEEGGTMEEGIFFIQVGQHYIPGAKDKEKGIYCPNYTSEGKYECPICDLVSQLWKGDDDDKELARKLRHDRKFWMNIIVRGADDKGGDTASGPFVFTPGVTIFNAIQALVNSPGLEYEITDPDFGMDLEIQKKGEKLKTEYQVFPRMVRRDIPIHTDETKFNFILDHRKNLSWVMLSMNKDEDNDLAGQAAIRLYPYDRMLDEFGIGPGMDVSKLEVTSEGSNEPVTGTRAAVRQRTHAAEPEEEALATREGNEDAVGKEIAGLRSVRNRTR